MTKCRRGMLLMMAALSCPSWVSAQHVGDTPLTPTAVAPAEGAPQGLPTHPDAPVIGNYYQNIPKLRVASDLLPKDQFGPDRMYTPTPVRGHDFGGVPDYATNTRPDSKTMGIRLDTSFRLIREFNTGTYLSEHQAVGLGGITFLPFQAPCWLIGTRVLGGFVDNESMIGDRGQLSLDTYFGSRYKTTYFKFGPIWDDQQSYGKVGLAAAFLTDLPGIGNVTADTAFGWGYGGDFTGPDRGPNLLLRRVEVGDLDMQIRLGKFLAENFQMGVTGNYYTFNYVDDEWGLGAFFNYIRGRARFGVDVTGGDEGLRGFLTFAYSWGAPTCEHPRDCRFLDIDTVGWVTRAVDRDPSVRLRQSYSFPPRRGIP